MVSVQMISLNYNIFKLSARAPRGGLELQIWLCGFKRYFRAVSLDTKLYSNHLAAQFFINRDI